MRIEIAGSRRHAEMAVFALRRGKRNRLVRADVHGRLMVRMVACVYKDIDAADNVRKTIVVDIDDGAHAESKWIVAVGEPADRIRTSRRRSRT